MSIGGGRNAAVSLSKTAGMDLGLRDRVVVVTGASSGIGLATCRLLIDEGADVVACARREGALESALNDLPSTKVLAVAGNVNEQSDMNAVVDLAMHRFGRLDGVACIAGRGNHGHALDLSISRPRNGIRNCRSRSRVSPTSSERHVATSPSETVASSPSPLPRVAIRTLRWQR